MDTVAYSASYHVTIYLHPASTDSGEWHSNYNVRLTGEELVAFNRRVAEVSDKLERDHQKALLGFYDRLRQMEREGKSTRNEGMGPRKPEFIVRSVRLEQTIIDGAKLMDEFDKFANVEGLWE